MTSYNHNFDRALQQDVRAWSVFTETSYTAVLRQMQSTLAQGFFGTRMSARHLIGTLRNDPVIGDSGSLPGLGENGIGSMHWDFDGKTDYVGLALVIDMLRMFKPLESGATAEVSSYSLKHTAERFLHPHHTYVSNGRLIWAAAALGLQIVHPDTASPNVQIGISEREHDYVNRMTRKNAVPLQAHHFRPVGYTHLRRALDQYALGQEPNIHWVPPQVDHESAFHDWLTLQAQRNDAVGDFSSDYCESVRTSQHRIVHTPDELLAILYELDGSEEVYRAGLQAITEWMRSFSTEITLRTPLTGRASEDIPGFGAGEGTVERYEYLCPCSAGVIIEEHDNIPGFRDHNVWMSCNRCRLEWHFADHKSIRQWGLVPVPQVDAN